MIRNCVRNAVSNCNALNLAKGEYNQFNHIKVSTGCLSQSINSIIDKSSSQSSTQGLEHPVLSVLS